MEMDFISWTSKTVVNVVDCTFPSPKKNHNAIIKTFHTTFNYRILTMAKPQNDSETSVGGVEWFMIWLQNYIIGVYICWRHYHNRWRDPFTQTLIELQTTIIITTTMTITTTTTIDGGWWCKWYLAYYDCWWWSRKRTYFNRNQ